MTQANERGANSAPSPRGTCACCDAFAELENYVCAECVWLACRPERPQCVEPTLHNPEGRDDANFGWAVPA